MGLNAVGIVVLNLKDDFQINFSLVRVREFEEVAAFLPQVEEAVSDVSKFSSVSFALISP